MGLPYLEGMGDTALEVGDKLGSSLKSIFRPNFDTEKELQQLLMRNPHLIDEFTSREQTSPDSTAMFGKNAQKYFATRKLSPEFLARREADKLDLDVKRQGITKGEREIKLMDQSFTKGEYDITQNRALTDLMDEIKKNDPKRYRSLMASKAFGITDEQFDSAKIDKTRKQYNLDAYERSKGLASFNPRKLHEYSAKDIEAYFSDPEVAQVYGLMIRGQLDKESDDRVSARESARESRNDAKATASDARAQLADKTRLMRERTTLMRQITKSTAKNRDLLLNQLTDINLSLATDHGFEYRVPSWEKTGMFGMGAGKFAEHVVELDGKVSTQEGDVLDDEGLQSAIDAYEALPPEQRAPMLRDIRAKNPYMAEQIETATTPATGDEDEETPDTPEDKAIVTPTKTEANVKPGAKVKSRAEVIAKDYDIEPDLAEFIANPPNNYAAGINLLTSNGQIHKTKNPTQTITRAREIYNTATKNKIAHDKLAADTKKNKEATAKAKFDGEVARLTKLFPKMSTESKREKAREATGYTG